MPNLKCGESVVALLRVACLSFVVSVMPRASAQPKNVDDVDPGGSAAPIMPPAASVTTSPSLPPKWAFGVLFGCYSDQAGVLDAMQRLRKNYCGDLFWIDSSWLWNAYERADRYICFQFDEHQFADPKAMISTLHENHFHFGLWEWPYIDKSITNLYQEGATNHFFITDQRGDSGRVVNGGGWHGVKFTGQLDFTNPKAVQWWKQLNAPLLQMGVDFFKIDTYSTIAKGGVTFDAGDSADLRRHYHQAYYEMTEQASSGRGFILAHRTPTPGNVQFPGMWTGDTTTSWAGFAEDMKRAAAMDTPQTAAFFTSDTGGYNRDIADQDELYIRWLEYGTFLPITEFFSAKNTKGRFPWLFNEEAQRDFKFYTSLRYRLLPFRYSNAQIACDETPVKYPVRFVPGTADEIILGNGDSEMLVAPVHVGGATNREVQLPAGKPWIDYWTGKSYDGGTSALAPAPLDQVPIFVKAGSIIPMGPDMHYVDEKPADPLTLDIYPAAHSTYTLFEDDGRSNDYKQGRFARTTFDCETIGPDLIVGIAAMQGDYEGRLRHRTYVLKLNRRTSAPARVSRNGAPIKKLPSIQAFDAAAEGWFNDAKAGVIWIKFSAGTDTSSKIVLNGLDLH